MLELKMLPPNLKGQMNSQIHIDHNPFSSISQFNKKNKIQTYPYKRPKGIPHLVSSINGKIEILAIKLPKETTGVIKYNINDVFVELVKNIPSLKIVIVIYYGNDFAPTTNLYKTLNAGKATVIPLMIDNSKPSIRWIQDIFYPINFKYKTHQLEEERLCLVMGQKYTSETRLVKDLLNSNQQILKKNNLNNTIARRCPIPFDGGNILTDGSITLIGKDSEYTRNVYKDWFGVIPTYVGYDDNTLQGISQIFPETNDGFQHKFNKGMFGIKQPLFHIDLFITLVGWNYKKEYLIMVGEPMLGIDFPGNTSDNLFNFLHHWINDFKYLINKSVDAIKKTLQEYSIKIIRNPLVLTYEDDIIDQNNNTYETPIRKWFWASYNNCLVQVAGKNKKVWLPSYGGQQSDYSLKFSIDTSIQSKIASKMSWTVGTVVNYGNWTELEKYDHWNRRIWEGLGFEVCLLRNNYIPFALDNGSLNCITNCIKRTIF